LADLCTWLCQIFWKMNARGAEEKRKEKKKKIQLLLASCFFVIYRFKNYV
jgi:hypothetical protein